MAGADEIAGGVPAPEGGRLTVSRWTCWCVGLLLATVFFSWTWFLVDAANLSDVARGYGANMLYVVVTVLHWCLSAPASLLVAAAELVADIPEWRLPQAVAVAEWMQWAIIWAAGMILLRLGVHLRVYHVVMGLFGASMLLAFVAK